MSKSKLSDYIQLAITAVRAAYGDFTGVVVQGIKYLPRVIAIIIVAVIILIILPVMFIQSLFTGDTGSPSGTFGELAVEALQYKEDWITVLAVAQTKKCLGGMDKANLPGAAMAFMNGTIEDYLKSGQNYKDNVMDIYNRNLELLQNILCSYAGYEYFYDEIPVPSSMESVRKEYNSTTEMHDLVATVKVKTGTIPKDPSKRIFEDIDLYSTYKVTIYASHDVVNYKVDGGLIKIKYQKYTFKAYFPIAKEYEASFNDDFGAGRTHDGKADSHEGNDIFAARNTPILAIEDCKLKKIGWNSLGGWRILLESIDGLRQYYYAHMENYADNLQKYKDMSGKVYDYPGIEVKAGDIIGYVGSSGSFDSSTKPGADTGTPPHLHFQLWVVDKGWFSQKETLLDPYYCLKLLENSKYSEALKKNKEKLQKEGL